MLGNGLQKKLQSVGRPASRFVAATIVLLPSQLVHSCFNLPMNKSMLAPEEQRVHSRTLSLGDAGGFPCARGGAALLAQRCSRRTALPCAADETECEPVCEPWR